MSDHEQNEHEHEFQITASIEAGGLTLVESRCAVCGKRKTGYAIQSSPSRKSIPFIGSGSIDFMDSPPKSQ